MNKMKRINKEIKYKIENIMNKGKNKKVKIKILK
jgi:hypothetical protein